MVLFGNVWALAWASAAAGTAAQTRRLAAATTERAEGVEQVKRAKSAEKFRRCIEIASNKIGAMGMKRLLPNNF